MKYNIEEFFKAFPNISTKRNRMPFKKQVWFDFDLGKITPICCIRANAGQTLNLDMAMVAKVAPQIVPPMQEVIIKTFAFWVPDRINWKNYKYWMGEKQNPENPEAEPTYVVPKISIPEEGFEYGNWYDNIGLPPETGGYKIDAYLGRGKNKIYNKFFRNPNLENPLPVNDGDEDDNFDLYKDLQYICKPRDIFTNCLKNISGTTPVEIPLGTEALVYGFGGDIKTRDGFDGQPIFKWYNSNPSGNTYGTFGMTSSGDSNVHFRNGGYGLTGTQSGNGYLEAIRIGKDTQIGVADLTTAMGAPLEGLYQAIAYNTYQYVVSRTGNGRYFELMQNIYNVANPDGTLQDPEFLGAQSGYVEFETITQVSETGETPLGNRGANGYYENMSELINKSFGEFGWIHIYCVATINNAYQQGVSKLMQTEDPLDLFNPLFNLMGDEPIYRSEIYVQPDSVVNEDGTPVNDEVFGYNKRNSRIIYQVNEIHGKQRSSYQQSLDANHFAQYFEEMPTLNKAFDKVSDKPFKRSLVYQDEPQFTANVMITGTNDIEIPKNALPSPIPEQLLHSLQ